MNERKQITLITVASSFGLSLIIALFAPWNPWITIFVVLGILIAGQTIRYFWLQSLGKPKEKRITKKEMETQVRSYFDAHPEVAARFVKMDDLGKKGRYNDAIQLALSLKKENLSPVVARYIDFKIKQFKRYIKRGLK